MTIYFEQEVLDAIGIPSIPKKEWDGKTTFDKGVAVVEHDGGNLSYAVCRKDETDEKPVVTKVFCLTPFIDVKKIFVVPPYVVNESEVDEMDIDEESKKKAKIILNEATDIENENVVDEKPKNEYYFDNIANDDEARAFIKAYNKRNRIKGRIPKTHDGLIMRLSVIFSDLKK